VERPSRRKLMGFLTKKAKSLKSDVLNMLMLKLRDAPTPFSKVKQMIQDLIEKPEAEAADEASTKAWCDTETEAANDDRDKAQSNIEDLNAFLTEKNALVEQLTEEIGDLAQQVADLQKSLNEAQELRNTEKADNEQTISDAAAGEAAVASAKQFLSDFYSGAAPTFVQVKQAPAAEGYERFSAENAGSDGKTVDDMAPKAVGGEYNGNQDASKSIIGLLEVIESDFQNAQSRTTADESDAAGKFATYKRDTETDISDKNSLKGDKEDKKETAELDIVDKDADLKDEKAALQGALDELVKLKPVCVDTGMEWEERAARREQEVNSLKEALKILQETDFGF